MTAIKSAVSKNLYRAHALAARALEQVIEEMETTIAKNQTLAARANGSVFAPPGNLAAEHVIEDLRLSIGHLRKRILRHREVMTQISRSVCLLCQAPQSRHCDGCGSCSNGRGLSCAALGCETVTSKVPAGSSS